MQRYIRCKKLFKLYSDISVHSYDMRAYLKNLPADLSARFSFRAISSSFTINRISFLLIITASFDCIVRVFFSNIFFLFRARLLDAHDAHVHVKSWHFLDSNFSFQAVYVSCSTTSAYESYLKYIRL